jgi:hypothetical protein
MVGASSGPPDSMTRTCAPEADNSAARTEPAAPGFLWGSCFHYLIALRRIYTIALYVYYPITLYHLYLDELQQLAQE